MQVRCPKCGKFFIDNERFCTYCGENLSGFYENQSALNIDGANSLNYDNTYSNQYCEQNAYNNTYHSNFSDKSDMSFKKWIVTVLVTNLFGIVSWVFLFVWGFGNGPEVRKKYCRAMLITKAISIALGIVMAMVYFGLVTSILSNNFGIHDWDDRGYYGYYDDRDYGQDASLVVIEDDCEYGV